jgi:hypothetical protein
VPSTDKNLDWRTDMATYNATNGIGRIYFHNVSSTTGDCSGAYSFVAPAGITRIRQRVYGVADMTGDGVNDILVVDADAGTIRWLTSESGYATGGSVAFGNSYMEVL